MDEDWRNAFGILMCMEICDGAGPGICNGTPSTCSSFIRKILIFFLLLHESIFCGFSVKCLTVGTL